MGKFRGTAHNYCNLKLRVQANQMPILVAFHNLENYDTHLIMQGLQGLQEDSEKYISFSLGQLHFIDLFNFMALSLDKLFGGLS